MLYPCKGIWLFRTFDTAGEFENAREPRFTQGLHEPKRRDFRASIRLLVGYLPYHGAFASRIKSAEDPGISDVLCHGEL
jgi:hypothetical protein